MAWQMLPKTKGLTDDEIRIAKERILKKAKEFGIDISGWDIGVKAATEAEDKSDPSAAIDTTENKKHAIEILSAALALMSLAQWKVYLLWIAEDTSHAPDEAQTKAYGDDRATVLLGFLNQTTRKAIDASLALGREAGETDDQLVRRIKNVMAPMSDGRAASVAQTESARGAGWAAVKAGTQSGVKENTWRTMQDAKVRETHAAMEGSMRAVGERFTSPSGATSLHPGGFGVPEEDCNCRCVLVPTRTTVEAAAHPDWKHFEAIRKTEEDNLVPVIKELFAHQTDAMVSVFESKEPTLVLHAMSLNMPDTPDHPNKLPFSGVLTFLDKPSDNAPQGSGGRKVILTKAAAEAALPTLLGMAVDHTPKLDGHAVKAKIGIIDDAEIVGDQVNIKGFLYAADFPKEIAQIKADVSKLGFSWELKDIHVDDLTADPWVINACVFTGAALLQKQKAAYTSTSLAAAADGAAEEDKMNFEEIMKKLELLAAAVEGVQKTQAEAALAAEAATKTLQANQAVVAMVKPHSDALRSAADAMEAAGIGCHASRGHALALRKMAANMDADAAKGSVPDAHNDSYYASAAPNAVDLAAAAAKAAVTEALAGVNSVDQNSDIAKLTDGLAALTTMVKDLKAQQGAQIAPPERKTMSPAISELLARAGIAAPGADGEKLSVAAVNAALDKTSMSTVQRLEIKNALNKQGVLA